MPKRRSATTEPAAVLVQARALLAAELGAPAAGLDWDVGGAAADGERLGAWLYALGRGQAVPPARLEALRPAWLAFRRQHLVAVHELGVLRDAFEHAGVPVIPLKGPVLAEALYRDPATRPFTDLDLLVPPGRTDAAISVLHGLGYRHLGHERTLAYERAHAGAACFVPADPTARRLPVDLHWSLITFPGGLTPRGSVDPGVWQRAVTVERLGRPGLELGREDLLLYLALHLAVHHPLTGLRWRLELAVFLGRHAGELDWGEIQARAHAWGVGAALYFALVAVERSLALSPPSRALAALRPRGPRGRILERLAAAPADRPYLEPLVNVLSLDRAADRLRMLRQALAPSAAWVRARYDRPSAWGGFCAHYGHAFSALARR